jgi:ankyrin repeat protein
MKKTLKLIEIVFFCLFLGNHLLSVAVVNGHASMVKLLLTNKAKVEEKLLFKTDCFPLIKYLLKKVGNPKATNAYGESLLHRQCRDGSLKNVQYLIENDFADVSAKNKKGQTPLHLACAGNKPLKMKIVKYLVEDQKADPAVACNEGKTALHYAAESRDLNILRYLIEDQKLDIEAIDNNERPVLHMACQSNSKLNCPTQKCHIEEQEKIINAKDKKGKTALRYCLENFKKQKDYNPYKFNKFQPIALILATKAKVLNAKGNTTKDHIFYWIKQCYESDMQNSNEEVSCLIAGLQRFRKQPIKKDEKGQENFIQYNPLLNIVSYCNREDIAKYMFNQDLNYMENHFMAIPKRTLILGNYINFCCKEGFLNLTRLLLEEISKKPASFQHIKFLGNFLRTACMYKQFNVFKCLLENAKDEAAKFIKDFPLHFVCKKGSLEMIQHLIEPKVGKTPLHCARINGSFEMDQYLNDKKQLDFETKDKKGKTPLYCALQCGSILIAQYLIEQKHACIDGSYEHGRNVFQLACYSGSLELVKYIQKKFKPDVNAQDDNGLTALHLACESETLKVVIFLISEMKARINPVDIEGRTPLHAACESKDISIAKFLVKNGADVLAKDKSGKIPLQIVQHPSLILFFKAAIER